MATATIPSISELGWVTDSEKKLDLLFSYYILTDLQQSHVFSDKLTSLPATYYKYISDPDGLATAITADLNTQLTAYFETADVRCYAKPQANDSSIYYIVISASVTDASGAAYELSRVAQLKDGYATKVISYNNYGDAYNDFIAI